MEAVARTPKDQINRPTNLFLAALIALCCTTGAARAQALLDPVSLTKFIDPVPNPLGNIIAPSGAMDGMDLYNVSMTQFDQQLHTDLGLNDVVGVQRHLPWADVRS